MPNKDGTGPKGHGPKDGHGKGKGQGQGQGTGQGAKTGGKKGIEKTGGANHDKPKSRSDF